MSQAVWLAVAVPAVPDCSQQDGWQGTAANQGDGQWDVLGFAIPDISEALAPSRGTEQAGSAAAHCGRVTHSKRKTWYLFKRQSDVAVHLPSLDIVASLLYF